MALPIQISARALPFGSRRHDEPDHRRQLLSDGVNVRIPVLLLVLIAAVSCASTLPGQPTDQDSGSQIVMAVNDSRRIPETTLTVSFEAVVEDSRCPTGVSCIREGDAIIRIRIDEPGKPPSTYALHTSGPTGHEIVHGNVRVTLVDVKPFPSADRPTRPDEYRVTLLFKRN